MKFSFTSWQRQYSSYFEQVKRSCVQQQQQQQEKNNVDGCKKYSELVQRRKNQMSVMSYHVSSLEWVKIFIFRILTLPPLFLIHFWHIKTNIRPIFHSSTVLQKAPLGNDFTNASKRLSRSAKWKRQRKEGVRGGGGVGGRRWER